MRCPVCNFEESKVIDSRSTDDGSSIRRRRECLSCGNRFTTYERYGDNPLIVIKSDGSSEAYNREKLFKGILIACAKRPVTSDQISEVIDNIESQIRSMPKCEVTSRRLGEMTLEHLSELDDVAYIRFASVYKDFQDVEGFMRALQDMQLHAHRS